MCYSLWCNAQPGAPDDGRNHRPKYVEIIEIINKLLLLHLFGCIHYLYSDNLTLLKPTGSLMHQPV